MLTMSVNAAGRALSCPALRGAVHKTHKRKNHVLAPDADPMAFVSAALGHCGAVAAATRFTASRVTIK